jgi:hypothetical protein
MSFEKSKDQALLFIYWCNKLREGGFIEGGHIITEKGFDRAMDLIDEGAKLDMENALKCCDELNVDVRAIELIMKIQELGYTAFVELSKKFISSDDSSEV